MRHFKNPFAVALISLKSHPRIAALGLGYVLAIMVYVLIQREVRRILAAHDEAFPRNKWLSARPTTEVVFRLFVRGHRHDADRGAGRRDHQQHVQ